MSQDISNPGLVSVPREVKRYGKGNKQREKSGPGMKGNGTTMFVSKAGRETL